MLTIQHLHAYQNLVFAGKADGFICPMNESDGNMISWLPPESDEPILLCLSCNAKKTLSYKDEQKIKNTLNLIL